MEEDGGPDTWRSRREVQVSREATRAYQQGGDEFCQGRRAEF